jgi:hypothetical protein
MIKRKTEEYNMRNKWLCPQLNRPGDAFAEANVAASSTAPLLRRGKVLTAEYLCQCGCKLPHNYAVSRLTGDQSNRRVLWYRHIDHRNRHASQEQNHV